MKKILKVGVVQHACSARRADNLRRSMAGIRACAEQGAALIVLQELHTGIYFCQAEDVQQFDRAEPIPGPSTQAFGQLAAELGVVLVLSLFERRAAGIYHNTAVVLERDGSLAGTYRKMHIPDDPAYYEKFYFTPGDTGFEPVDSSVGRLGLLVCWDQWYPEAARLMAMRGADLLIYPTAIGYEPGDDAAEQGRQLDAWQTIQRSHAIANGLPVVAVNRVGFEPDWTGRSKGIAFWGHSFVAGPQGELLYQAGEEATTAVVDIDLGRTEAVRRIWPFFRDRRIEAYGPLARRYLDDQP